MRSQRSGDQGALALGGGRADDGCMSGDELVYGKDHPGCRTRARAVVALAVSRAAFGVADVSSPGYRTKSARVDQTSCC